MLQRKCINCEHARYASASKNRKPIQQVACSYINLLGEEAFHRGTAVTNEGLLDLMGFSNNTYGLGWADLRRRPENQNADLATSGILTNYSVIVEADDRCLKFEPRKDLKD